MVESVEYLERIANVEAPPLNFAAIEEKKSEIQRQGGVTDAVRMSLKEMEDAFRKPGDLSYWTAELLEEIDQAFVKNYVVDNQPVPSLFFPDSTDNLKLFMKYCREVDNVLRKHSETAPPYAREYFLYYSIWQMRGFKFPMPLGTASVVEVLNKMLTKVKRGFAEVSAGHGGISMHSRCIPFSRASASALTTLMAR